MYFGKSFISKKYINKFIKILEIYSTIYIMLVDFENID